MYGKSDCSSGLTLFGEQASISLSNRGNRSRQPNLARQLSCRDLFSPRIRSNCCLRPICKRMEFAVWVARGLVPLGKRLLKSVDRFL